MAKQIAEAFEAAHEQGIVHRDLKPANIKIRPDGTVKVLDFGLAKAMEPGVGLARHSLGEGGSREPEVGRTLANSPTITSPAMTQAGMILGTAAYMAPEQAKGKIVDRRVDVWAFGCVLYEMLSGRKAFEGEDITDTIVAVMSREPAWDALPATLPPAVHACLRRCLQKDVRQRVRDIGDARLALEGAFETASSPAGVGSAVPARASRQAWGIALVLAALVVGLAVPALQHLGETPAALPETRLDIVTPPTDDGASFALSPDGSQIAFAATSNGRTQLWLRSLSATTAQPIDGTDEARAPFWSPDGRSLGFFSGQALKRVDLAGGAPRTLAPALCECGGTWNADGTILYAPSLRGDLRRVPASGGPSAEVKRARQLIGRSSCQTASTSCSRAEPPTSSRGSTSRRWTAVHLFA
jgi:hypothetical protein